MWHARFDITCDPWVGGFNHAIWAYVSEAAEEQVVQTFLFRPGSFLLCRSACAGPPFRSCMPAKVILGANALHMLLLGDFGYYYIKHRAQCKDCQWRNVTESAV